MPHHESFRVNGAGHDITHPLRRICRPDLQNRVFLTNQGGFWAAKQLCLVNRKPYGHPFNFNFNSNHERTNTTLNSRFSHPRTPGDQPSRHLSHEPCWRTSQTPNQGSSRASGQRPGQELHHLKRWIVLLLVMLWGTLVSVGCRRQAESTAGPDANTVGNGQSLEVVVTTGMVRDLVDALLPDDVRVTALMGPGVDPHLHQPTRTDAVRINSADLVVYNGLHLEGRLGEVLDSRSKAGKATISVGDQLPVARLLDADAGLHDPHIWMDVALWSEAAEGVAVELIQWQPSREQEIRSALAELKTTLEGLDQWSEQTLATIPEKQRLLITAHDAFRYFGRRYAMEVHGVQGVSTMSEAAISDANRLVDLIVSRGVSAVFFETSVSERQVKAIVEGARRRGMNVSSDSTLYSDSLGSATSDAGTYVGMIRHNVQTVATALGGQVLPYEPKPATKPEPASEPSPAIANDDAVTTGPSGESS